jgi:N-acetylglucosamine kinase-like BadF-type ATPase
MRYVLGFDGGGTKTECVLMDEASRVLARSRSGPSNPMRVGFGGALAAICEAARSALNSVNLPPAEVTALCAGLAGTGHTDAERKMKRLLEEEFSGKTVIVCTDLELTLEATGEGPAIVLIAGTGSAAVGRDARGQIARIGGHGPLLGDEGSAFDVGQRAAIAAVHEFDRTGGNSAIGKLILQELDVSTWHEVQSLAHSAPDEVFPRIFPVIVRAADQGDPAARELLLHAADDLATLVAALMQRLKLHDQKFLLVKTGGMIGRSFFFDQQVDERLRAIAPHAQFGAMAISPAESAARLALQFLVLAGERK